MALGRVMTGLIKTTPVICLVRKPFSTGASSSTWSDGRIVSALQHLSLFGSAAVMLYFSEKYSEKRESDLKIKHIHELIGEKKSWDALQAISDLPPGLKKHELQAEVLERLATTTPIDSSLQAAIKASAKDERDLAKESEYLDSTPIFKLGISALWGGKPEEAKVYFEKTESLCRASSCFEQAKLWQKIAQRAADTGGPDSGL